MPITLGIYDFFAYLIPGLLYLFVFNEFLRSVGWKFLDIYSWIQSGQAPAIIIFIPILIGAYVVGHVLEPVSLRFIGFFYRLRYPQKVTVNCLTALKQRYPDLVIQYEPKDWNILFSFLRQRNIEMAHVIDKFQADSIMLRNISFGMFILFLIQLFEFIATSTWTYLINCGGALLLCVLAMLRSIQFRNWFFTGIFEASLEYGTSLKSVSEYTRKINKIESISPREVRSQPRPKQKRNA